ncbi:MAG: hypothetical protein JSV86_05920 [Gemmatimonadota bacterium]|nr:MAG: hypothetical protein JSV86_05920 [Gemmatimonadota bacterium]
MAQVTTSTLSGKPVEDNGGATTTRAGLDANTQATLVAMIEAGETAETVAAELSCGIGTVQRYARRLGLTFKKKAAAASPTTGDNKPRRTRKKPATSTAATDTALETLYVLGELTQTAIKLGMPVEQLVERCAAWIDAWGDVRDK